MTFISNDRCDLDLGPYNRFTRKRIGTHSHITDYIYNKYKADRSNRQGTIGRIRENFRMTDEILTFDHCPEVGRTTSILSDQYQKPYGIPDVQGKSFIRQDHYVLQKCMRFLRVFPQYQVKSSPSRTSTLRTSTRQSMARIDYICL